MNIRFFSRGARGPASPRFLRSAVLKSLGKSRRLRREVNVVWVGRERLRQMNRVFRKTNRFTDVISFRYQEPRGPFGDLYISPEQARRNALVFKVPWREELVRLAVHGALHLLGHTDYEPRPRAHMWAVQEKIVRKIMGAPR